MNDEARRSDSSAGDPHGEARGEVPAVLRLDELLRLDDEALVDEGYRRLLLREPDPEGRAAYLRQLRLGKLSKVEFLGHLRYSAEGRERAVRVKGLAGAHARQVLMRVPVIGYCVALLWSVATLPRTLRSLRAFQSTALAQARLSATGMELMTREVARVMTRIASALAEVPRRQQVDELEQRLVSTASREELEVLGGRVAQLQQQLEQESRQVRELRQRLLEMSQELTGAAGSEAEVGADRPSFDEMYLAFENHFRGSREEIARRLQVYLPDVRTAMERSGGRQVLDLGCGRGEWLELLKDNQITARGVDASAAMVRLCHERGLAVSEAEVLAHLLEQPDGCYAVVTGFHLAEHLPFARLIVLLDQVERILLPGGTLILETPNPENLIVGGCTFHTDPTHRHPLVPETLRFFVEQRGFRHVEVRRLHPFCELHEVEATDRFTASWMHNEMDYAVLGVKA